MLVLQGIWVEYNTHVDGENELLSCSENLKISLVGIQFYFDGVVDCMEHNLYSPWLQPKQIEFYDV
jgi:hypothetical protein